MHAHDSCAGARWAFYLDTAAEPEYRRALYALEQMEPVLTRLQALPAGCGAARVWEALADVPRAGTDDDTP
jgi:hypothetical protein